MQVHLVDGTYELFRQHFGVPAKVREQGTRGAGVRGVLGGVLTLLEGGATHVGVATDHVIESFRNEMWPGYKNGDAVDPDIRAQFEPLEEALQAMGVKVWPMVELEADDALASAAEVAADDPEVEQVVIHTADKDIAQCVRDGRVVQVEPRTREVVDEAGVVRRYGVPPASIPDYLALVGDTADGYPGLKGWGPKAAAAVLSAYGHIEQVPEAHWRWKPEVRGALNLSASLNTQRDLVMLFRDLATLRVDRSLLAEVDELRWRGPSPAFGQVCERLGGENLARRAAKLASAAP